MSQNTKKWLCILGIICLYLVLSNIPVGGDLKPTAQKAIALMVCAVLTWSLELLPLALASVLFTVLTVPLGLMKLPKVMTNFADPSIFFVFAMFCNAIAFQNSGLCSRIVLWTTVKSKGNPRKLSFYLMFVTAIISMVLADIPAIAMMYPVGLMLLEKNGCVPGKSNFGRALMLGLPLASLIGGIGTPSGSSMNVMTLTLLQSTADISVSFFQWSAIGVPMAVILIVATWFILERTYPSELSELKGIEAICNEYECLGPITRKEWNYIIVFFINLALWATDTIHRTPLPVIAVIAATLFCLPNMGLIEWKKDKNRVGWDILMLIGASTAIGKIIWQEGGSLWLAETCLGNITVLPVAGIIASVCVFTIAVHLLIPVNTAIVAVLLPTLVSLASMKGINPALLAIPLGFSVSASLLLPLGPVPLVTFPAGYYKMYDLFKPGCIISLVWVVVMVAVMLGIAVPIGLI